MNMAHRLFTKHSFCSNICYINYCHKACQSDIYIYTRMLRYLTPLCSSGRTVLWYSSNSTSGFPAAIQSGSDR